MPDSKEIREHVPKCTKRGCLLCIRWYTSERHRVAWGGPREAPPLPEWWTNPEAVPVPASIEAQKGGTPKYYGLECVHRGEPTGETAQCGTCGSYNKEIPVYSCPIKGKCTIDSRVVPPKPIEVDGELVYPQEIQYCRTCKEKKRPPKEGV